MAIKVKICGLKTAETLGAAVTGGAAFVGFNFVPTSPRYVAPDIASELRRSVPDHVNVVALSVDPDDNALAALIETVRPDMIQLHGNEDARRVAQIRDRFGKPIIKACPIATNDDVDAALAYESLCDHLLLDARAPKGATYSGGHGTAFDWSLLATRRPRKPWMLAGGLTVENAAEAAERTGAPILDLSSGVERAKGEKDVGLIKSFLDLAQTL